MSSITIVEVDESDDKLSWTFCPPELLQIIFKKLDFKSLLCCMTVNRRWKDVAVDYIEFYHLWPEIVAEQMLNMGVTFERKSTLGWQDLLTNSILWSSVRSAHIEHHHTYNLQDIKQMHVYRDILIVKTSANVKYFNIRNCNMVRFYESPSKEIDFTENDYMRVALVQQEDQRLDIHLYGKVEPDDSSLNKCYRYGVDYVLLYRLEDNICYIVTNKYVVWALIWDMRKWDLRLVGRYYGGLYDRVCAMHVFNNTVYMVTKHGLILGEVADSRKFEKVVGYSDPPPDGESNWVFFNKSDVAVAVKSHDQDQRIRASCEIELNHMRLECAEMTCATEHGETLFLGFRDGVVAICRPDSMSTNECKAERLLCVTDFDKTIEDPKIVALEVSEDKLSHHLFIATQHKIIQLLITYPLKIRTYYED